MTDPLVWTMLIAASLTGLVVVTIAALKGWRDWIDLQRRAMDGRARDSAAPLSPASARIELADLKERVRKLEAIAAGVDP